MTTNVLDKLGARVTSDSRWSVLFGQYLCFVDDTGFDKIADRVGASMICAGDADLIHRWKEWFYAADPDADLPDTERVLQNGEISGLCVAMVEKPAFNVSVYAGAGEYHALGQTSFCGSGAIAAMACYAINSCAMTCVTTAGRHDPQTGGTTRFVDFQTLQNNLSSTRSSFSEALEALITRGKVMDLKTRNVTPLDRADQDVLRRALKAGTVALSAPTGQVSRAWTQEEKDAAKAAMRRIVEREKASNCD